MKKPIKIYLFGSENNGWALDSDLATTRQSLLQLPDIFKLSSLNQADVVYAVWEYPLLHMDPRKLEGKKVVCQVCNDFMRIHEDPCIIRAKQTVGLWIAMSRECKEDITPLGYKQFFIPYAVDTVIFTETLPATESKLQLLDLYGIAENSFVISNFMRDSNGQNLLEPKSQKGTELLLEIGINLLSRNIPVHFLLAGPRRHWIRKQLDSFGFDYTFVGKQMVGDDADVNILSAETINKLYHLSDLHLITSRWEGGPRAVLECAATRTVVVSTPVGIAPDILGAECLFESVDQGVRLIEQHYHQKNLTVTVEPHYQTLITNHTPDANVNRFARLYEEIEKIPSYIISAEENLSFEMRPAIGAKIVNKISTVLGLQKKKRPICISLWHEFHKPPYGGGNQFMLALSKAMQRMGVQVVTNKLSRSVDVHICNSAWFDSKLFEKKSRDFPLKMIHRIDGPTTLYRGQGRGEDDKIFAMNKQFASATVFQSAYSFKKSSELGYESIAPVIIHNSVNADSFNDKGRRVFSKQEKIRLISSSWSDNPRKGGPFLKWLDDHLDWSRFEYTFVGRVKETFENIQHIPPQDSQNLAAILRDHHVFLSVSHNEPCSNALLEALACGLPAIYRNDGGNGELVSFGGLPFNDESDILEQLDSLVEHYVSFQRLISINSIESIAKRYIQLAEKLLFREGFV